MARNKFTMPFNKHLETIDACISIDQDDRQLFTQHFDSIRNHILKLLKRDRVFNYIFNGPSLFGSYLENLKIGNPNEFDVHLKLKLPYQEHVVIKRDSKHPGFIILDIKNVLTRLRNDKNQICREVYNTFLSMCGVFSRRSKFCIIRSRLNDWLQDLIEPGLEREPYVSGYELFYSRGGVAHTISAKNVSYRKKIKIDFAAAFVFDKASWMAERPFPPNVATRLWFAVPKSIPNGLRTKRYSFSICAPQLERDVIWDRTNLKRSLRLLKSLRTEYNMPRLKSYFIKTVYLLEVDKIDPEMWQGPLANIFVYMLGILGDYFREGFLPFYWDPKLNLLDILSDDEIEDYADTLAELYFKFKSYLHQRHILLETVWNHFKNTKQKKLDPGTV